MKHLIYWMIGFMFIAFFFFGGHFIYLLYTNHYHFLHVAVFVVSGICSYCLGRIVTYFFKMRGDL